MLFGLIPINHFFIAPYTPYFVVQQVTSLISKRQVAVLSEAG